MFVLFVTGERDRLKFLVSFADKTKSMGIYKEIEGKKFNEEKDVFTVPWIKENEDKSVLRI
jgi:hypothetical protein